MTNLFSSFDPASWFNLALNWTSSLVVLMLLPLTLTTPFSKISLITTNLLTSVLKEFSAVSAKISSPGILLPPLAIFYFIGLNNFNGLFPFVFTSSAHLTFACSLAIPLWLGHILLKNSSEPNATMTHLVPLGTPPILMPFMVLIELVSNIIRPLTLSVRLAANMIAGHLLITLVGHSASPSFNTSLLGVMLALALLCLLESAVSLIQAYVFCMLSTLYFNEVNSSKISSY